MKRLIAFLTSIVFLIISQAWLIHAMDMKVMHDNMAMPASKLFTPKVDIFCSKSLTSKEASCFQEISESKWITSWAYKIWEVFQISFMVFFAAFSLLVLMLSRAELRIFPILWPPKHSYLSLIWIIRNIN
ncbi:MAG: hypothetical protein ACD_2C00207G0008 [uncultured bacterium (gcode 4)]|uniref:Uncharacterized protein n=1 Tax=uncultured bacterium (gcode 4) TaxID=1234023 RepID=K2G4G7_9BACT|nr:MAG: hypothetical protein ACD_2C00207G0008 [uncultured bacterium (gcode 4)]